MYGLSVTSTVRQSATKRLGEWANRRRKLIDQKTCKKFSPRVWQVLHETHCIEKHQISEKLRGSEKTSFLLLFINKKLQNKIFHTVQVT